MKSGSFLGFLQKVKVRVLETEMDLNKAKETINILGFRENTLAQNFSSLTEEPSAMRVEHANFCADLDKMAAIVQRMKYDGVRSLSTVSVEVQKTYNDMADFFKQKIEEELVDGWKKMNIHFQLKFSRLAGSAKKELQRHSSDDQSLLTKISAIFSVLVTKA